MALLYQKWDTATNETVFSASPNPLFDMVVLVITGDPGVTELGLTTYATLTADCDVDVLRNGQDLIEGATRDYTRDVGANKIVFNYTVPKNSAVKIKVYKA